MSIEVGPVGIDPLAATVDGVYSDPYVEVRGAGSPDSGDLVHTEHFDVSRLGPRVHLVHRVPTERIDDDLAGLLADELFSPGWLRGQDLFERLFTGIVLTTASDPLVSWSVFYANTMRRISDSLNAPQTPAVHGTIAEYAPVYSFTEGLLAPGSVLELGSCFGFLSLRLASAGRSVTASDLNPGTTALLDAVGPRLGISLNTRVGDACQFPASDDCADNVLLIHVLEHLEAEPGRRALAEAIRLARRRVVVAVPLEDQADETWGHVRTISLTDLDAWGTSTGLPYEVREHHGGWLVVDVGA